MNYDDTVRLTMQHAQQHGWEVVQDTAWEGYTKIPTWIMQGYATLADEAHLQLLIPVDVVNFVTPVKTAGVNWRREQATRQKFYVTSRVTAVPVADGKYKP